MTELFSQAQAVTRWLDQYFTAQQAEADKLKQAMVYSALNGGKRLRGCLVLSSAQLASDISGQKLDSESVLAVAGAVEMLHAYSLIHDDLPAMDDAELRRGKAAAHIAFDEATAILAGDALQTEAFVILSTLSSVSAEQQIALIRTLAAASGLQGMAGGQMLDLQAMEAQLDASGIRQMQELKTGALISASCIMGGIAGGGDALLVNALERYSQAIGYAFQIADDLLDVQASAEQIGKPAGRDEEQNKASIVRLFGVEKARQMAQDLVDEAVDALSAYNAAAQPLNGLAQYIITRNQ